MQRCHPDTSRPLLLSRLPPTTVTVKQYFLTCPGIGMLPYFNCSRYGQDPGFVVR
jgi:hypothetical protein